MDDAAALESLKAAFAGRRVLVLAPGATLADPDTRARVAALRGADADAVVSANFVPEFLTPDYAFFTNAKRLDKMSAFPCPVILTSNLRPQVQPAQSCVVGYDRVAGTFAQGGNSVVMLLRLLAQCGAKAVLLAGADGYTAGRPAYADASLHAHTGRGPAFHAAMAEAIRSCGLPVTFVTPSAYEQA